MWGFAVCEKAVREVAKTTNTMQVFMLAILLQEPLKNVGPEFRLYALRKGAASQHESHGCRPVRKIPVCKLQCGVLLCVERIRERQKVIGRGA